MLNKNNRVKLAFVLSALMGVLAGGWMQAATANAAPTTESAGDSDEGTVSCATTITRIPCAKPQATRNIVVTVKGANNVAFGGSAVTYATSPVQLATGGSHSANRSNMWCIATGSASDVNYSCLR